MAASPRDDPILFVVLASSDVHWLCRDAAVPAYERVEAGDIAGLQRPWMVLPASVSCRFSQTALPCERAWRQHAAARG